MEGEDGCGEAEEGRGVYIGILRWIGLPSGLEFENLVGHFPLSFWIPHVYYAIRNFAISSPKDDYVSG